MSKRTPASCLAAIAIFAVLSAIAAFSQQPTLTPQNSHTTVGLIAVSPVDQNTVWAVGTNSTYVVTTDGGNTWRAGVVPTQNSADIQLRDVQGVSAQVAYVLSIGNLPGDFGIWKTTDGGATWTLQFQNQLVGAFYDCFAFWTPTNGVAHSDSVKIWLKEASGSGTGSHTLQQFELNCVTSKIRTLSLATYNRSGDLTGTREGGKWESVIPDTLGETLLNGACKAH